MYHQLQAQFQEVNHQLQAANLAEKEQISHQKEAYREKVIELEQSLELSVAS